MKLCPSFLRIFALAISLSAHSAISAENPFADIIRKTEPLTPAEELKTFHLPPGFEIQLVASEPDISKPMNMAFDAEGRLWITQSREYPFPVLPVEKPGRDKIQILENFDTSGRAGKISTFADGLNIPMGLYPYKNGVLAFSIPNIYFFQDTDGDGRADKKELFLGRFGYEKDTHGLTSHFTRGFDGWLYADHGFNNDSTLTAKDGSTIKLNSGNTYRIKIDGSHIEQFTWGQVNPFGLMFDPMGDLWASDCHSSPVYQLLRHARYPSFGKPHDGLGFAPNICEHSHGSTAIAGMVFYDATNFPPEFRHNTFVGNVMTCRINRDSYIEHGSTRIAKEEPDFLTCDDPWFRPVDIQLGPDGALYVADFYNRIIGHYEVPLDNPGRDRERGRIWRIVYTGEKNSEKHKIPKSPSPTSRPSRNTEFLLAELGNANITRRMLAMNELTDRIGEPAIKPVAKMLRSKKSSSFQKVHGLWVLFRLGALDVTSFENDIFAKLISDADPLVRVHVLRVLSEKESWNGFERTTALSRLKDENAYVQRAAADALGQHPSFENVSSLLKLRGRISPDDEQLLHVTRMSLRNQLLAPGSFQNLRPETLSESDSRYIADVAVAITNSAAGDFLLQHVQKFSEDREKLSASLRHIARYADSGMNDLAKFTENQFADDLDFQLALFKSIQEGSAQRGKELDSAVREWGARLAKTLFASVEPDTLDWRNLPFKKNDTTNPWGLQERPSADGKSTTVISSWSQGGEKYTGVLRSKPFQIPAKLSFYLCGHDGLPGKPPMKKNIVRLRDADSNEILASQAPPRNDTAQLISWDLSKHSGKKGYLEIVDGNSGNAYAWLGIGRFDPEVVPMPRVNPNQVDKRQREAAQMAQSLKLTNLEPQLAALLNNDDVEEETRGASAKALASMKFVSHLPHFEKILNEPDASEKFRQQIAEALADINSTESRNILIVSIRNAPRALQNQIALSLASNAEGAAQLIDAAEKGIVSARLLQENSVRERLGASKDTKAKAQLEKLIGGLTPLSAEKQKLIDERRSQFAQANSKASEGRKVFTQNCAVCHQLDKEGALVGPQLDGVGNRGADRLIEDILDPNRNVDAAFRTTLVILKDGDVQSGLFRREEGEVIVLADSAGKETSIPKDQIKERRQSESSLMPDNFSDVIAKEDFNNLISFLLTKGTKTATR